MTIEATKKLQTHRLTISCNRYILCLVNQEAIVTNKTLLFASRTFSRKNPTEKAILSVNQDTPYGMF